MYGGDRQTNRQIDRQMCDTPFHLTHIHIVNISIFQDLTFYACIFWILSVDIRIIAVNHVGVIPLRINQLEIKRFLYSCQFLVTSLIHICQIELELL